MVINDNCISCSACMEECNSDAIYDAGSTYIYEGNVKEPLSLDHTFIAPELCTECKNCWEICAVDAIEER